MKHAFSLVELSIVLVILGLLTGGILGGQSLIRAAELRNISMEYSRYVAASQNFRDKYFSLPGDMRNATSFWGAQSGAANCTNNAGTAAVATGTCDGNANGTLNLAAASTATDTAEIFQFWRQLALAGLMEGTYTGLNDSTSTAQSSTIGTNIPRSKVSNGGWALSNSVPDVGFAYTLPDGYGTYLLLGGQTNGNLPVARVLKAEEAWNIDTKMDDGKPTRGTVIARYFANECGTADDGATHTTANLAASYNLSNTSTQCAIYFRKIF